MKAIIAVILFVSWIGYQIYGELKELLEFQNQKVQTQIEQIDNM